MGDKKKYAGLWWKSPKEKDLSEDRDVDGGWDYNG
jgi:hypothetical protein